MCPISCPRSSSAAWSRRCSSGQTARRTDYEIVAGKRRFFASEIAAKECEDRAILPCIVLGEGDDAEALEVSMIENLLGKTPIR